jgi:hypothetical protein
MQAATRARYDVGKRLPYPADHEGRRRLEAGVSHGPDGRIFISYRRTDTAHIAGRLFDRLEGHFGTGNVFMDVDSIAPGSDFADAVKVAVGSCDVLLALIGRHWANTVDEPGRNRLEDVDDFVSLEISTALQRQILVIPVVVDGANPPNRKTLPETLTALSRRQAVPLDHATFRTDVTVLFSAIEDTLRVSPARTDNRANVPNPTNASQSLSAKLAEPTPTRPAAEPPVADELVPSFRTISEAQNRMAVLRSEEVIKALERAWNESSRDQEGVLVVNIVGIEGYYFQFLVSAHNATVYAELGGSHNLSPWYQLTTQQCQFLEHSGWVEPSPPESPNYSRTYDLGRGNEQDGLRNIALDVIRAVILAYRVPADREYRMEFPESDRGD